jgi:hypothetical protein
MFLGEPVQQRRGEAPLPRRSRWVAAKVNAGLRLHQSRVLVEDL